MQLMSCVRVNLGAYLLGEALLDERSIAPRDVDLDIRVCHLSLIYISLDLIDDSTEHARGDGLGGCLPEVSYERRDLLDQR